MDTDVHKSADRWPKLPQFSLRSLLLAVGLCSVLLAVMNLVGALWSTALVWFLLLVAAHVFGNAWGTRSRTAPRPADDRQSDRRSRPPVRFAPSTRLRGQICIGRCMIACSALGAVIGGCLGTYVLW